MPGKYGPYVKWAKVNATLPKELSPETVTLDEALGLIAEKAGKGGKAKQKAELALETAGGLALLAHSLLLRLLWRLGQTVSRIEQNLLQE